MKLTTKLLMLGLVGVAAAPFILKKPDGTPWLTLQEVTSTAKQAANKAIPRPPQEMYRWQDSSGKWHYSDQASGQYQSQRVQVEAAYNEMKHIELPDGFGENKKAESEPFNPLSDGRTLPLTTAPLEQVPEMMKEIERVQEKLEQRQKALNNL